jgi:para-aminobenzoate synthetase/4-amino-4-deoxychorismate lyase
MDHASSFVPLPFDLATLAVEQPCSVVLQTSRCARSDARSLLFRNPVRLLQATRLEEVEPLLAELDRAVASGLHAAGYLSYESGFAFEQILQSLPASVEFCGDCERLPLVWFGLYEEPTIFDHTRGTLTGPDASKALRVANATKRAGTVIARPALSTKVRVDEQEYTKQVEQVRRWIAEGQCYQLNLTTGLDWREPRSAAELFHELLAIQPVEFAALLQFGDHQILSFSPELFFERNGDHILTRPMKGTAPRGLSTEEDVAQSLWLANDEKNRSENLMIVDLLRNDLGRICKSGSVSVAELFAVERYATLLQMTSTVSGELREDPSNAAVLRALFPSGSITGAPKIRAMQLLRKLEPEMRGVYTGAIGYMAPHQRACFNVAIRTLELHDGDGRMGIGSGIVYDSNPRQEYDECLLKGKFLSQPYERFELIETMLWDEGFPYIERHLLRLQASARYFERHFDLLGVRNELCDATAQLPAGTHRVRLKLDADGRAIIDCSPFRPSDDPVHVVLAPEPTDARDLFLRHKTTRRVLYDQRYAWAQNNGYADALFFNTEGHLTEGCIHSVFLMHHGRWSTPPCGDGVLPGVLRGTLLDGVTQELAGRWHDCFGSVHEQALTLDDLRAAEAIYLGNALRGLRRVERIDDTPGTSAPLWRSRLIQMENHGTS